MIQRVCDRAGCVNEFGGKSEVNKEHPKVFMYAVGSEGADCAVMDLCDDCAELLDEAINDPEAVKAIFRMLKARRTRGNKD